MIAVNRKLDLSKPGDLHELQAGFEGAEDGSAVEDALESYLSYFNGPAWRTVYSGGFVLGPRDAGGFELGHLLAVSAKLEALKPCDGSEQLVQGLRNPTQVRSTIYEVEVASWCSERSVHRGLVIGPRFGSRARSKRPDLRWETSLGVLWCECKEASITAGAQGQRLQSLGEVVMREASAIREWPKASRVDVTVNEPRMNGVEARIAEAIQNAYQLLHDGDDPVARVGEVEATIRRREEPIPPVADALLMMNVVIGPQATRLASENAFASTCMRVGRARRKHAARLIREARSQLPDDEPSAIFLGEVGDNEASKACAAHLDSATSTAWCGLWQGGSLNHALWRNEQPFDDRLLQLAVPGGPP